MDIKVDAKSAFILKTRMLSMFAPFSQLSHQESLLFGLMVYYTSQGRALNDPFLIDQLVDDIGSSKQVLYNTKSKLKKKGLINGKVLNQKYVDLISKDEYQFTFTRP